MSKSSSLSIRSEKGYLRNFSKSFRGLHSTFTFMMKFKFSSRLVFCFHFVHICATPARLFLPPLNSFYSTALSIISECICMDLLYLQLLNTVVLISMSITHTVLIITAILVICGIFIYIIINLLT